MPNISGRIKSLRKSRHVTQKELGAYLGVSQNAVFNWESGKTEPSAETIEKIAAFFKVNPAYLMGWTVSDEKTEDIICNSVKDDAETQEPEESAAIAAYFDGEGYTDKELKQIERFAHYIKSLRNKNTE